jgi:hypothetical protein
MPTIRIINCINTTLGICYSVWIIIRRKIVHQFVFYLQEYTGIHSQQNIKFYIRGLEESYFWISHRFWVINFNVECIFYVQDLGVYIRRELKS